VGIVDPDALPNSERPSPAAPSTVTAAALVVRVFLEACLTRRMVGSSVHVNPLDHGKFALGERGAQDLPPCHKMKWNLGERAEPKRIHICVCLFSCAHFVLLIDTGFT
jgi:hypothetical protein